MEQKELQDLLKEIETMAKEQKELLDTLILNKVIPMIEEQRKLLDTINEISLILEDTEELTVDHTIDEALKQNESMNEIALLVFNYLNEKYKDEN